MNTIARGKKLALSLTALLFMAACGEDLGECDLKAANELVYSDTWRVATKGQALLNDSCGNASFCHSSRATGGNRQGAPQSLDFDMVPAPSGWRQVMEHRDAIWSSVVDGTMPPEGEGQKKIANGGWSYDAARRAGYDMPTLATGAGKAALRNWLACGAPVVADTEIPLWARTGGADLSTWRNIYREVLAPNCATGGCHDDTSRAGNLSLADECKSHAALLQVSACDRRPRLVPGDGQSYLVQKLRGTQPANCGDEMPPGSSLSPAHLAAIETWIVQGAVSDCAE
jgi:hypothetical protein